MCTFQSFESLVSMSHRFLKSESIGWRSSDAKTGKFALLFLMSCSLIPFHKNGSQFKFSSHMKRAQDKMNYVLKHFITTAILEISFFIGSSYLEGQCLLYEGWNTLAGTCTKIRMIPSSNCSHWAYVLYILYLELILFHITASPLPHSACSCGYGVRKTQALDRNGRNGDANSSHQCLLLKPLLFCFPYPLLSHLWNKS